MHAVLMGYCKPGLVDDLMHLEKECFGDLGPDFDREYYKELLSDKTTMSFFLEDEGKRVGCLIFIPHPKAAEELKEDDPGITPDPTRYYVETVEILPELRGRGGLSLMLDLARRCGMNRLALHARVNNGFSDKMRHKLKNVTVRRIESWPYYEDKGPTDYFEGEL